MISKTIIIKMMMVYRSLMGKCKQLFHWFFFIVLLAVPNLATATGDSFCATVKIEIRQELTLERQAFDAQMRINNGLDGFDVEDVKVDVKITDENGDPVLITSDPDNTEASFFIRIDSMSNIDDVSGSGVVLPKTSAEIHWLIIPAPGSGGETSQGKLYYIGATLTYTLDGKEKVVEVSPDYVYVRPMPLLTLDYFLPRDVYADDAFTPIIEPIIPFNLGVRVKNNGRGPAYNLKIDSAQPKIIENELGLLIGFRITGSSVNDEPVAPTLLVDIGDIEPSSSGVARWQMETTLSGEFVEFTAEFSHADELGGELTSLLEATNAHELIRDVMVDLPGRDNIRDFLAKDGGTVRVYESSGLDTEVTNQSSRASIQLSASNAGQLIFSLEAPPTDGFIYVKLLDPNAGTKKFTGVMRSDGKAVHGDNVWLSKTRRTDNGWDHYIHLFDVNSTGIYQLGMENLVTEEVPPILQYIPNRNVVVGSQISFIVEASDLNGTLPSLIFSPVLNGLEFFADANGPAGITTFIFDWTPTSDQVGMNDFLIVASDGQKNASQAFTITVCGENDSDCDGMDDTWEREKFQSLDRDGQGDFDGDGFIDLLEFVSDTDPVIKDAPSVPAIKKPLANAHVSSLTPELAVNNSIRGGELQVTYEYEIFDDENYTQIVSQAIVYEQDQLTAWASDTQLNDNQWFFWRVRACDPDLCSEWANSQFFVNTVNDKPEPFSIASPVDGARLADFQPLLTVNNSRDIDGDTLTYKFEVYENGFQGVLVASSNAVMQGDNGMTSWKVSALLEEDRRYYWQVSVKDAQGEVRDVESTASFMINTINQAPPTPLIFSPADEADVSQYVLSLLINNSIDSDADSLVYQFELDRVNTFDSTDKKVSPLVAEKADGLTSWLVDGLLENQRYYWRVKADDGRMQSDWAMGRFFVNAENEAPSVPIVKNPGDGAWVENIRPTFSVHPSIDPENEALSYQFELYSDRELSDFVFSSTLSSGVLEWLIDQDLDDNSWVYWRVKAIDVLAMGSEWSITQSVFINDGGIDDVPTINLIQPDKDIDLKEGEVRIAWIDDDPDSNAVVSVFYEAGEKGSGGILIQESISEDVDGENDAVTWNTSGLEKDDYFIYAQISDESSTSEKVYAVGKITVGEAVIGSISVTTIDLSNEAGVCGAFNVALDVMPDESVFLSVASSSPEIATLSTDELTFTPENWNISQIIKVSGFSGCVNVSGKQYQIIVKPLDGSDGAYTQIDNVEILLDDILFEEVKKPIEVGGNEDESGGGGGFLSIGFLLFMFISGVFLRYMLPISLRQFGR